MNYSIYNSELPAIIIKSMPIGTVIDYETINIIREIQKPLTFSDRYFQYYKAVSIILDINNRCRSTYLTFSNNDGKWRFIGICFSMNRISMYDKKGKRI